MLPSGERPQAPPVSLPALGFYPQFAQGSSGRALPSHTAGCCSLLGICQLHSPGIKSPCGTHGTSPFLCITHQVDPGPWAKTVHQRGLPFPDLFMSTSHQLQVHRALCRRRLTQSTAQRCSQGQLKFSISISSSSPGWRKPAEATEQ